MKNIPLITVSAAAALLIYLLFIKKRTYSGEDSEYGIKPNPREHHLTNVFAKAKAYATE